MKYKKLQKIQHQLVASFAEAWIEIFLLSNFPAVVKVASFAEAWIEMIVLSLIYASDRGRLLRGGVD